MQAEQPPQPGQLIGGKYRIVRPLGSGAMGVVYEAQHVATGKRVAIKWLHADVMQSRSAVERLVREAQAAARVRHSNVVDVYDVERDGDTLFLVMEYLEGEPLASLLERGGVPVHELLAIIVQAMRGVAEAHRSGVVHRDIKPENIFLAEEADQPTAVVKVLDFGVSKMDNNPGGVSLTQTGSALGTPLYMSYEQLSGVRDVDARSDVYSFGVILYEALTGTLPFTADSFAELAAKVITSEPMPPRQIRPDIPERLEEVVLWAMKKRREERAPSLSVLIEALLPFTRASGGRVSLSSPRLPALGALGVSPGRSAQPPSTPGLKLDEQVDWNAVLDRSQRERREMEDRVTALVAGTMYEERKKSKGGRGAWLGVAAVGALALGVTLATLMRDGDESRAQSLPEEPPVLAPPAAPEQTEPLAATKARTERSGAAPEAPELLQPASPTQVEPMRMPKPEVLADAGAEQPSGLGQPPTPAVEGKLPTQGKSSASEQPQAGKPRPGGDQLPWRPAPRAAIRPKFEGPSGELVTPPPPPVVEGPSPLEPPAASEPTAAPEEPTPSEERPADPPVPGPSDPVGVNPFEDDEPEAYRAGRPREDEF